MSKNKLIKRLLTLCVATVSALSVFGMAACKSKSSNKYPNIQPDSTLSPSVIQLGTPIIEFNKSENKITWSAIEHATGYKVYENSAEKATVNACEYNITQTVAGSYEYYVVAISTIENCKDSNKSNSITYNVPDSGVVPGEITVADYATDRATAFEAKYANLTDEVLGDLSADVPVNEHKFNITNATSYAAVDAAYDAGVTACDNQIITNAKTAARGQIDNYRSDENFNTNATDWSNAKNDAKTAINAATSVEEVKMALANGKTVLDAIDNDTEAEKVDITIQIIAVVDGVKKGFIGEFTVKSGDTVTVAQIEDACNLSYYIIEGFYEDEACANKITDSKTFTSLSTTTIQIYAKVTEKSDFTVAGTYTWSVSDGIINASDNVIAGMFEWDNGKTDIEHSTTNPGNSSYFKFEKNTAVITITLKLKAGQKVTVTTNTRTGSASGAYFGYGVTGATLYSAKVGEDDIPDATNISLGTNVSGTFQDYVVKYTVDTDGEVIIQIRRVNNTVQMKNITILIEDIA